MTRLFVAAFITATVSCAPPPSSNDIQRERSNKQLTEGASQVGIPAIVNFRELKLLKDIYELRDQEGLVTYTYVFSEQTGTWRFFCDSVGYGLPYSAQLTANETEQRYFIPEVEGAVREWGHERLPQAEPNGIFPPDSAEGTWVMCNDAAKKRAVPVYIEPRIIVSPFKLSQ